MESTSRFLTKADIVVAAMKILNQNGWKALTMRGISSHLGLSTPTIYRFFSDKEQLQNEISRIGLKEMIESMRQAGRLANNPEDSLINVCYAYWKFGSENREIYQLIFGVGLNHRCTSDLCTGSEPTAILKHYLSIAHPKSEWSTDTLHLKSAEIFFFMHGLLAISIVQGQRFAPKSKSIINEAITIITHQV